MTAVPVGVRLGIDVGSVRIGVARSDPAGTLAVPVETVPRDGRSGRDLRRIAELVAEYEVVDIVVGLPRSLSGREGPAAVAAREFADRLASAVAPVPVGFADERFTTVTATRDLRAAGVKGRDQRAVIDQAAAVAVLQSALDAARRAPGTYAA